jgi:hypothetical protein
MINNSHGMNAARDGTGIRSMKIAPSIILCIGVFGLSSCNRINNEFVIVDQKNVVTQAEVRLCGKQLRLAKSKGEFTGTMPITCEGEGSIFVRLSDGSESSCHIGYVTPGIEQSFEFVVKDGHCR